MGVIYYLVILNVFLQSFRTDTTFYTPTCFSLLMWYQITVTAGKINLKIKSISMIYFSIYPPSIHIVSSGRSHHKHLYKSTLQWGTTGFLFDIKIFFLLFQPGSSYLLMKYANLLYFSACFHFFFFHLTVLLTHMSALFCLFSWAVAVTILFSALETHTEILFWAQIQGLLFNSTCSLHKRHYMIHHDLQTLLVTIQVLQTATESLNHVPVKASQCFYMQSR